MDQPIPQAQTSISHQHTPLKNTLQVPHAPPQPQPSSGLLSRLPYDCRLIIYQYLLDTPFTRIERSIPPTPQPSLSSSLAFSYTQPPSSSSDDFQYRLNSTTGAEEERGLGLGLSLLLSCRQLYNEVVGVLYAGRTFIFTLPQDISRFLELAPERGGRYMRSVVLGYGRVDWRSGGGPIYDYRHNDGTLDPLLHWEDAFKKLAELAKNGTLKHLEVWMSHRNNISPGEARRPREGWVDEGAEKRHGDLFGILGRVKGVKEFVVRMSWNPVDVLKEKEGEWPFTVSLMSADEMGRRRIKEGWPVSRGMDLCD